MQPKKMKLLIIGDSMVKYLDEYLPANLLNYEVDLHSFPGATIERLRRKISFLDNRYHLILVHVGTNNSNDSVEDILKKYDCLFKDIKRLNPNINVIISDILPRGEDFFTTLNQRVAALNRLQVVSSFWS
ncbi:platelet-activating factor acetylhydrolase IB subunit beta-like [Stegodyphus dumicola]|uniref:platelet-activating factor acetylhydrolase IB subunit beta-like n=1 Tax=Stegodyphus dumicola TaxID=202533 RepID=UPI0015B0DB8D|nr:platelet-activating factor acetylhydrolase IB subunit beta-like [Stegodyphus dumicola]